MNRILDKIKTKVIETDITIEDLIVCPIDDHMTLGVQMFLPKITVPHTPVKTENIVYINNLIIPDILIL